MGKQKKQTISGPKSKRVKVGDGQTASEKAEEIPRPDLYVTIPKQAKKRKPGQLSKRQLEDYFDKGFIILKDFIDHKVLDDVREDICDQINKLAEKLFKAGKINNKHEDKGFLDRLIYLEREFPGAAVLFLKSDYLSPAFQKIWSDEKLLNVVEQLIGPEVSGHPVWNIRPKVPKNEQMTVPWHQDNAYFDANAINTFVATAWIPFVDATTANGCMQMIPYGHHLGKTATHTCCVGETFYVDLSEEDMKRELGLDPADAVTCEVPYGGVLLFNNCIPHRSLDNVTDGIRWSVDLRWQRTGDPVSNCGNPVVMRSAKDPNMEIDWSPITKVEYGRNKQQEQITGMVHDDLDPVISGPWMLRWKIIHHNKHTAKHAAEEGRNS